MNKFMLCACGALLAGVTATAAEVSVTGNNTAVVIQKDVVESSTKYQFLCVPVKGFDISGNKQTVVTKLAELLPPATTKYVGSKETTVTIGTDTYTIKPVMSESREATGEFEWQDAAGENADGKELSNGDIFWLQNANPQATVFCGEENIGLTEDQITNEGGMVQVGNAGSEPIDITKAFTDPKKFVLPETGYAYLYVVVPGANDYRIYRYESVGNGRRAWTRPPVRANGEGFTRVELKEGEAFITPGEAFYLQGVKKAPAVGK